jgi:hypothetical protein
MKLLQKLWPWSRIAELERERAGEACEASKWYNRYSDARDERDYARREASRLRAELATLRANSQPRDPKTGRLVSKKGAA